jgi:uncharacterized membrane protein
MLSRSQLLDKLDLSPESDQTESLVELTRLNNLSDGVFAIALTLLAFDIRLPDGVSIGDLPNNLLKLAPNFIVYLISFVVIGGAWGSHQRMLKQIKRGDGLLVWFNLLCLLFVALLPACAAILGRYPDAFLAIACFALDVAFIQLATLWLWRHSGRQGLINETLDPRVVDSVGRRLTLSTAIFVLSIPLSLLSIWITYFLWVGLFILLFTTDWLTWQLAARKQQTTFPIDNAKRASIRIRHAIGRLRIDAGAEKSVLLNGVFGGGLTSRIDRSEDASTIQLSAPERRGLLSVQYPWSWGSANVLDWTLHLSDQIPIALEIEIFEELSAFELGALQITDLRVKTTIGNTEISLPDREGDTTVNVNATQASLIFRVPPDVAASVQIDTVPARVELDPARFPMIEEARYYRSPDYETAMKRVDIRVTGTESSVRIQ